LSLIIVDLGVKKLEIHWFRRHRRSYFVDTAVWELQSHW